jgi:transposase-like protein
MDLVNLIKTLSKQQKSGLIQLLSNDDMDENSRYRNGNICPHCKNLRSIKRGVIRGNQRFYCPNCNKYFTAYAKTILNYTKKDISTWKSYIKMMFESKPKSIKEIISILDISESTAFRWRHKITSVLEKKFMNDFLQGIVEADETFILSAHKGKHLKGVIGRRSGGKAHYRGLSHEQAGVLVAIDRNKNLVSKVYGYGKITKKQVSTVLNKKIRANALLITDKCASYKHFADENFLEIRQLKAGKTQGNGIHLNTVNSYHSTFKRWLSGFNGISTKYLSNYLAWFKFVKQKNDCGYLFNDLILA